MARYYFNLQDDPTGPDVDGCELADLALAKCEAARTLGAMVCDAGEQLWSRSDWNMTVTDEVGVIVFTLTIAVADAPASLSATGHDRAAAA